MKEVISYREQPDDSRKYKENYLKGIEKVIEDRENESDRIREQFCTGIFQDQERYREDFKKMLGWPLTEKKNEMVPAVEIEKLTEDGLCEIYRMSIEVLEGFSITGLLFKKDDRKKPLVIVQHGGGGTPELVADLYGYTGNYNHTIERLLQYDVNVFAPQLLLWNTAADGFGVYYNRIELDAKLKRVGSSITALEVYGITRILDYFEAQDYVGSFGMAGLSYGGFYTLFIAAIEPRIRSAISSCYFNRRRDYPWPDWTWFGAASRFSDAEIACMVYPRKLCIEVGTEDEIFHIAGAEKEMERLKKMNKRVGKDWLRLITFQGTHEFFQEDEHLKKLVEDIS